MTRISEKAAVTATALSAAAVVVDALLGARTQLLAFTVLLPFGALSLMLSLLTWARARLARVADEERRDADLARTERPESALFATAETEPFSIGRTAQQFERFFVPVVPLLLGIAFGWWAWHLHRPGVLVGETPEDPLFACAFLAGQSFFLFLLSRYLLGLARDPVQRLLRAPGIALGLTCLGSFAGALAAVAVDLGAARVDLVLAQVLTGVVAVLAIENVFFFLVSLYTPIRARKGAVAYESRLGALLTDPAAWARDLAQSFDYQFGFKVSETTSYRFLRNALLPLIMFQIVALYLMSSLVFLGPDEEGVLERFGRPLPGRWHLTSGFHLKRPWPFDTVRRVPARRVLTTYVGFAPGDAARRGSAILWTVPHYKDEDTFVTASHPGAGAAASADATSVGLISFNMPVEYRVTNIYDYVYSHADPAGLLRDLAYRALTREIAVHDLVEVLGARRSEISERVRDRVQRDVDDMKLGVEILFVGVQGVHPPVPVAAAFQSVVGAMEQREAAILQAHAYTNRVLPVATANADRVRIEGEATRARRTELARAEADLFDQRLAAYRRAPAVFANGLYLNTLQDALRGIRKYIVDDRKSREVLYFNFQEKPYPDLFDLGPAPTGGALP